MFRYKTVLSILLLVAFLLAYASYAAEHPSPKSAEHPGSATSEHPSGSGDVSADDIAKAIHDYVSKDIKLKGGYFLFYDKATQKCIALTLTKVHDDKLCQINSGLCFACADFKATDGNDYDLDFFVSHKDGKLEVSEISLHKVNGKERYRWSEENGIWMKLVSE